MSLEIPQKPMKDGHSDYVAADNEQLVQADTSIDLDVRLLAIEMLYRT